jgi:hypothetical protein
MKPRLSDDKEGWCDFAPALLFLLPGHHGAAGRDTFTAFENRLELGFVVPRQAV